MLTRNLQTPDVPGRTMLSARADTITPQPMFRLLAEARAVEATGRRVIHMEIGDTSGLRNDALIEDLRAEFQAPDLGYGPSAGNPRLREWIAAQYAREKGAAFTADHVVISPANALICQLFAVLTDPGDAVLVPDPGFPTYALAARYNGLKVVRYALCEEAGWNPDPDALAQAFRQSPRPRLIVINTPSNPLGVTLDSGRVERIMAEAAEHGVACVVDETYKNLIYDAARRHPGHHPDAVYLYSFSKDAAAPGLRLGCAVGDPAVAARVADFNSMFYSCAPTSLQRALTAYLERGEPYARVIRDLMPRRIQAVDALLRACPALDYVVPDAAFYVYLNIHRLRLDAEEFTLGLLHRHGVCVCPGTGFGPAGRHHVRISLAGAEADVLEGARRIAAYAGSLARAG